MLFCCIIIMVLFLIVYTVARHILYSVTMQGEESRGNAHPPPPPPGPLYWHRGGHLLATHIMIIVQHSPGTKSSTFYSCVYIQLQLINAIHYSYFTLRTYETVNSSGSIIIIIMHSQCLLYSAIDLRTYRSEEWYPRSGAPSYCTYPKARHTSSMHYCNSTN